MKFIFFLTFIISIQLQAGIFTNTIPISTNTISADTIKEFLSSFNSNLQQHPPFDSWETSIEDDTPPDEEDRNITTKTINKSFILSLASLNSDNTDYEKKEEGDGDNPYIEVSIDSDSTKISNTITWNPTQDGKEHIDSEPLTPYKSVRDAQLHFHMCASITIPNLTSLDFLSFVQTNLVQIHDLSECEGKDTNTNCEFSDEKQYVECYSTNHFAIKPEKLSFTLPSYMKSAKKEALTITADATGYSFSSNDDYNLSVSITKYTKKDEVNNSLYGEGNFTFDDFTDGNSSNANFDFNDTAKINFELIDKDWAEIDDDTLHNCDENGSYICGNYNTIVIPDHFNFKDISLHNESDQNFTYLSNSEAMQAHIAFTVNAKNAQNNTLQNFDKDSWENNISLHFSLSPETDSNKTEIFSQFLGFEDGSIKIDDDNATLNQHLSFNYTREVNNSKNPFFIRGDDIHLTINSIYDSDNNITGFSSSVDKNITFLYARTNTPRTRISSNEGDAKIYYEVYCNSNTTSDCNKTLLPDSVASLYNNDPRWYNNSKHTTTFGSVQETKQKQGTSVTATVTQESIKLKYDDSTSGFPYKTTMQNIVTSWLVYNKYNSNADANEFEVEFEGGVSDWVGKAEENVTTTKKTDITRANRRISW
jgi:hypothetical protein